MKSKITLLSVLSLTLLTSLAHAAATVAQKQDELANKIRGKFYSGTFAYTSTNSTTWKCEGQIVIAFLPTVGANNEISYTAATVTQSTDSSCTPYVIESTVGGVACGQATPSLYRVIDYKNALVNIPVCKPPAVGLAPVLAATQTKKLLKFSEEIDASGKSLKKMAFEYSSGLNAEYVFDTEIPTAAEYVKQSTPIIQSSLTEYKRTH